MSHAIVIHQPERRLRIILEETRAGRREVFDHKFMHLLELHASLISEADTLSDRALLALPDRIANIYPSHTAKEAEFGWSVTQADKNNVFGRLMMNGALIRHGDLRWGNHT